MSRAGAPRVVRGAAALAAASKVLGVPVESFAYLATDMRAMMGAWSKATGKRRSGADARKMRARLMVAVGLRRSDGAVEVLDRVEEGEEVE